MKPLLLLLIVVAVPAFTWDEVPASLRNFLNDLNETVKVPYEELLDSLPDAAGTITLHFDVMPDGALWNVDLEADSSIASLVPVIQNALSGTMIELEEPIIEPVPVTVPMVLQPGNP
jgi:hypothetical protein